VVRSFVIQSYLQLLLDRAAHHALMELMKINFNISSQSLLIGAVGIIIGCISAFSFSFITLNWVSEVNPTLEFMVLFVARFAPGCTFGFAVAVIYFINAEQKLARRILWAGVITITGLVSYEIAFWITFMTTSLAFTGGAALIAAPAAAAVGGFVATSIFLFILQAVTNKYSDMQFNFSLCGGLLGALLIDSIAYVINSAYVMNSNATATSIDATAVFLSSCIFFVGWQTIMLLAISSPLLIKEAKNQITTLTAVVGPANDAALR
jgi:hypothetical protein